MGDISILLVLLLKILLRVFLKKGIANFFFFLVLFPLLFFKVTARERFSVTEIQNNLKEEAPVVSLSSLHLSLSLSLSLSCL